MVVQILDQVLFESLHELSQRAIIRLIIQRVFNRFPDPHRKIGQGDCECFGFLDDLTGCMPEGSGPAFTPAFHIYRVVRPF